MKKGKIKQLCHNVAESMELTATLSRIFNSQCNSLGLKEKEFDFEIKIKINGEEYTRKSGIAQII